MIGTASRFLRSRLALILVIFSYLFFTVYYMGPSVWDCSNTVYGFGDNTAGPIWRFGMPDQSPLGSYTSATNYPVGESLYNPVNYSLSIQAAGLWGISKVINPVCGYNVFNMGGFVVSALVMYGFIHALTRNKWIAWLSGFAVSFSPYYQMKVGGHPGYGYQALLIGTVWAFYNAVSKRRKKDVVLLGGLTAANFYFDPYFSLLVVSCLVPLVAVWAGLSLWNRKRKLLPNQELKLQLRTLLKSALIALLLILPLIFVTLKNSKEITSSVAAVRGNVLFEARACSNLPHEYAIPFVLHPLLGRLLGNQHYKNLVNDLHSGFDCGIGEDTVGISLAILGIASMGIFIFAWEGVNKRRLGFITGYDKRLVIFGLLAIALFALIMALPPVKAGGVSTPSYMLLMITSTWRTLTRYYVIVNFAVVGLAAVTMAFLAVHFSAYKKWLNVVFCVLFLFVFVEYQAFRPFSGNKLSTFNYERDVPQAYQWLKNQSDIQEIAEYPLERAGGESNAMAYYLSMQVFHKKTLFNGSVPTTKEEDIKASLKDISDSMTQRVLRSIGIDVVVIHGIPEADIRRVPGLKIVYSEPQSDFNLLAFTPLVKKDNVVVARLIEGDQIESMLTLEQGFVRNTNIIKSAIDWEYEALNGSILKVSVLPGKTSMSFIEESQCFSVRMAGEKDNAGLSVIVDGRQLPPIPITHEYKRIKVGARDSIKLLNDKGFNMRVKDLGCSPEEL